jgi:hypothetical protein
MLPGSVGVACSPNSLVSLEGMGCEPILNLASDDLRLARPDP